MQKVVQPCSWLSTQSTGKYILLCLCCQLGTYLLQAQIKASYLKRNQTTAEADSLQPQIRRILTHRLSHSVGYVNQTLVIWSGCPIFRIIMIWVRGIKLLDLVNYISKSSYDWEWQNPYLRVWTCIAYPWDTAIEGARGTRRPQLLAVHLPHNIQIVDQVLSPWTRGGINFSSPQLCLSSHSWAFRLSDKKTSC